MKVLHCSVNNNENKTQKSQHNSPNFRAAGFSGALNLFGSTMQGIENGGFLASFLIQDVLGMTAPRVGAAFLRDKEVTGKYNIQEGLEVLGREALTGPCMMAVAPITFAIASRFGRTTSMNSQLIRNYGNKLKDMLTKTDFDKSLLKNKDKFKEAFYKTNIEEMLSNTLGKEHAKDEHVKYILEQLSKYENIPADAKLKKLFGKSKYRSERLSDIAEYINNIKYSTSPELQLLDKVKVGSAQNNDLKTFATREALESMVKYSDDAIALNKNLDKLDASLAEDIKNSSIAKRFIANVATMASTLGVLSILPKIYAKSDVAPGARTAMELKENKNLNNKDENNKPDNKGDVSFKAGKGGKAGKSLLAKIGEYLSKFTTKDFAAKELEYNGHNFTNTLMAGLSLFGLLTPRGLRAYNRAQVDEDGKKDLTELYEILIRDISSSLAVVFAVPMLTRACVTSYEKGSGFVLMQKDRTRSGWSTALDLINPYSSAHVLKNSEINSIYNKVDTQEKMVNFCKYINENGGDLHKIFSKSEHSNVLFNDNCIKLADIEKLSRKEKNQKILSFFENTAKEKGKNKEAVKEMISKLMSNSKPKANKILSFARGLNSIPGVITTFLISPYILGWFIPRLTYANTRRIHENKEKEKQNKTIAAA